MDEDVLTVTIPGEPVAQGRPRAFKVGAGIRTFDPPKSRNWKAYAADLMGQARGGPDLDITFPEIPLSVRVVAVFSCPKSAWKKREPVPRRPHAKRPDGENVAKAVLDAATGAGIWCDDAQVARLTIEKFIGAQGEPPHVVVEVTPL